MLAIVNPTGGVGKTTTAINLGAGLAVAGMRVLILDLDPQGNASTGLGVAENARTVTSLDVLSGRVSIAKAAIRTRVPNLSIIPANADLARLAPEPMGWPDSPFRLRNAIAAQQKAHPGRDAVYDYLVLDCPPSFTLLTLNAMVAAHAALVPVQCEFFALSSLHRAQQSIAQIGATLNSGLEIQGVVLTMCDAGTPLSREVETEVRSMFGDRVYKTMIPRNVRVAEAPSHGKPVLLHDYDCPGSQAYIKLSAEFLGRPGLSPQQPSSFEGPQPRTLRTERSTEAGALVVHFAAAAALSFIEPTAGVFALGLSIGWHLRRVYTYSFSSKENSRV